MAMTPASYSPGEWTGLVTASGSALLHPDTSAAHIFRLWRALESGAGISRCLEILTEAGFSSLRPFALVEHGQSDLRIVVRGEASVTVAGQRFDADGVSTWRECIAPVGKYEIAAPGAQAGSSSVGSGESAPNQSEASHALVGERADGESEAGMQQWPLAGGIVRADCLRAQADRAAGEGAGAEAAELGDIEPFSPLEADREPGESAESAEADPESGSSTEAAFAAEMVTGGAAVAEERAGTVADEAEGTDAQDAEAADVDAQDAAAEGTDGQDAEAEVESSSADFDSSVDPPSQASPASDHERWEVSADTVLEVPNPDHQPQPEPSQSAQSESARSESPQPASSGPQAGGFASPFGPPPPPPVPAAAPPAAGQAPPWAPPPAVAGAAPTGGVSNPVSGSAADAVGPGNAGGFSQPSSQTEMQAQGDHDGETVLASQLPRHSSSAPATEALSAEPVPPRSPSLKLVLSTGEEITLTGSVLIGRAPESSRFDGSVPPRLVSVPSPNQDISRTHVEIRAESDGAVVTDLNSTNGTVLTQPVGSPRRLHGGESAGMSLGAVVDLGDGVTVTLAQMANG